MNKILSHQKLLGVISILLVVVVTAGIWLFRPGLSVEASGMVSIDISQNPGIAAPQSDVRMVFNPSGTHIHNGKLKVRFDVYLGEGSKSYDTYNIDTADEPMPGSVLDEKTGEIIPELYEEWWATVPKHKELQPVLCHFVTIDENTNLSDLQAYLTSIFNSSTLGAIDEYITYPDSIHYISPLMRDKSKLSDTSVAAGNEDQLINTINSRLGGLTLEKEGGAGGEYTVIEPQSIEVGYEAIDRSSQQYCETYTAFPNGGSANGTGVLETVQVYVFNQWYQGTIVAGTIYAASDWSSRDYQTLGSIGGGGGLFSFTGLDIEVETGDYLGVYGPAASGYWYIESDRPGTGINTQKISGGFPFTDASLATTDYNYQPSLYGAGTEGGGDPDISNTPSSYNFGTVNPSTTISTGLDYFTVTNNSDSAVNITISGTDITGGIGWALSDTGTPDTGTAAIIAGLYGGSYNIVVKKTTPYNALVSNLASEADQDWGLQLWSPTNYTDSVQKAGTVTLTATIP